MMKGLVVGWMIFFIPICMWTDRTMDFWLTHFNGVETNCPWYLSTLITFVANGFSLLGNVISEVARIFVG